MDWLAWIRKAITAGLAAGIAAALPAVREGRFSQADIAFIVGSVIVGGVAVFVVPNGAKPGA